MKKLIFLGIFATVVNWAVAQDGAGTQNVAQSMNAITQASTLGSGQLINGGPEAVKGSPFLNTTWMKGELIMNDGKIRVVPIKYNSYKKEVMVRQDNGDSLAVFSSAIKGFRLIYPESGLVLPFIKVENLKTGLGVLSTSYVLVLYDNKVGLYKHLSKDILNKEAKNPFNQFDERYNNYTDNSEYFFRKSDNSLVKIKFSKKSLLNAMKDKEDALKAFLEKEHLEIQTDSDVVKVMQYYESL